MVPNNVDAIRRRHEVWLAVPPDGQGNRRDSSRDHRVVVHPNAIISFLRYIAARVERE